MRFLAEIGGPSKKMHFAVDLRSPSKKCSFWPKCEISRKKADLKNLMRSWGEMAKCGALYQWALSETNLLTLRLTPLRDVISGI